VATAGTAGVFGFGGTGGFGALQSGGGGGGGYFGGGGGGGANISQCGNNKGAGGGGGSSFVGQGSLTATPVPDAASVLITYAGPTADESTNTVTFASTQPQSTVSPEQTFTVTNNGGADLTVSGYTLAGTNPGDYIVSNSCEAPVAAGGQCVIGVRFAPQAPGASTATLTLSTNAPNAPGAVTLSGTGGTLPQGPKGDTGATGAQGNLGPQGPAGQIRLVRCTTTIKRVHGKRKKVTRCTTKLITSGTATFKIARAGLLRHGHVAAIGKVTGNRIVLHSRRALRPGRYVLRLTSGRRTMRQTITIR
jgi:hypothetical protein